MAKGLLFLIARGLDNPFDPWQLCNYSFMTKLASVFISMFMKVTLAGLFVDCKSLLIRTHTVHTKGIFLCTIDRKG